MEYFFEKMAARGWMLRDAVGSFWGFERQTPKKVKFSVVILKEVSMWEGSENEKSKEFQFYCESAGWHFVCAEKCRQILWSGDRDIVPIETDEALKMDAAKAQFQKQVAVTMVLGVLWILCYFGPALMGGMGLAGYLLESLLETNAGILVLFCMLYLFLNGLAGVVSYQVWYQRAKRDLQRKKPVRYRSYPFFMVKDIAAKAFCLLLGVLFYTAVVRSAVQNRDWRALAGMLLFFTVYGSLNLFMWSRRKKGFRWRYLLLAMAAIIIMAIGLHKIDSLASLEPPKEDSWLTGMGPFLQCSELFAENKSTGNGKTDNNEILNAYHTRRGSILLEKESYRTFRSGGCRNEFSYTLYRSGYKGVLNYVRKLSENHRNYKEEGGYWDGSIYIQGYSYRETGYTDQKTAGGSTGEDEKAEETYRVSVLRNGPYILMIRYRVHDLSISKDVVDSRAAEKMRELPGIL